MCESPIMQKRSDKELKEKKLFNKKDEVIIAISITFQSKTI